MDVSRETFGRVFFAGKALLIKGVYYRKKTMGKSHYRYVYVQNKGSSELQVNRRYFWK